MSQSITQKPAAAGPPNLRRFAKFRTLLGRVLLTVRFEHGNLTLKFLKAHAALSSSPGNLSSSSSASCSFNLRRFSAACASSSRCQSFVGLHFLRATVGSTESAPRSRRPRRVALTAAGCCGHTYVPASCAERVAACAHACVCLCMCHRAVCLCVCLVRRVHENGAL
jgi:hypothetical protein